jgi:hypothetical protein
MSEGGAPPGWYPDFWTPSRKRYWTGSSWTFATKDSGSVDDAPPEDVNPLPGGHGLPAPVVARPPAGATTAGSDSAKRPQKVWKWALAVILGLLVGVVGVVLSTRSDKPAKSAAGGSAIPDPLTPTTQPSLSTGSDPSATALVSLVVTPDDVPTTADVVLFPGGAGLNQPTLDLCNGRYPSESRRTARLQDAVLDPAGKVVLSTEAVLYADSGGTTQAFSELQSEVARCPKAPVAGAAGEAPVITTFAPPPDAAWAQTPTVTRRAYDLTSDNGTDPPTRTIAVYLQRGRALLGVYFSQPAGAQMTVAGQTTIEGIVGVFAGRLAALPTSVVGS